MRDAVTVAVVGEADLLGLEPGSTITIEIGEHPFEDAWDHWEDGVPGECNFPFCVRDPEEHDPWPEHECESHPRLVEPRCRHCGLAMSGVPGPH